MRSVAFALVCAVGAGCNGSSAGGSGPSGSARDATSPHDLGVASDQSSPEDGAPPDDQRGPAMTYRYAVDKITLPMSPQNYALDLNGDTVADNALGRIVSVLLSQGIDAQMSVDSGVAGGANVELLKMVTSDPALQDDDPVAVSAYTGLPGVPDFGGMGQFSVDGKVAGAIFGGALVMGHYSSENPVTTTKPVTITLKVSILPTAAPLPLVLHGAHIQFEPGDPMAKVPALHNGQINGSIKNADVQNVIIPAIAMMLDQEVQANPGSQLAQQILQLFDTGGCTNPNNTMAQAGDGRIDVCEVATNGLIAAILSPDVQIYDDQGNYAPNPKNTKKDSLSVGLGFTAVRAKF